MARRKRGRASAARHVLADDRTIPLARDCKHAERIGGRARIGGGLTEADIVRATIARGFALQRRIGDVHAEWACGDILGMLEADTTDTEGH